MTFDEERFDLLFKEKEEQAQFALFLGEVFLSDVAEAAPISPKPWSIVRPVKRRNRIRTKVQRHMNEDTNLDLQGAVDKVTDYAGGRLLVHYLGDVLMLHKHVCAIVESRNDVVLHGPCEIEHTKQKKVASGDYSN